MTPAEHAAAILAWLDGKDLAAVECGLGGIGDDHPLLIAATALADAADSDQPALRDAGLAALFAGVVEPLNDGFSPAGRALYARVFARVIWRVAGRRADLAAGLAACGIADEAALVARHRLVRRGGPLPDGPVRRVAVLSRVTIGADILLTSLALVRARQRFPDAEVVLIGDGKLAGLFAGLYAAPPALRVRALAYRRRGGLGERLLSWLAVRAALDEERPDLLLAPDSRLDQLGLLPLIDQPARYLLWENTQPEGAPARSLADLYDDWLVQRLGLVWGRRAVPTIGLDPAARAVAGRLRAALGPAPLVAVKLDHGGNPAKALPRAAELLVLRRLRAQGWRILLDRGFGAEETANSDALLAALGWTAHDLDDSGQGQGADPGSLADGALAQAPVVRFHGSIAGWAAAVSCCRLAVSYDSVGHHLAAALGVPVVVAFTGHASAAFPVAWQPRGRGAVTVVVIDPAARDDEGEWGRVAAALPAADG